MDTPLAAGPLDNCGFTRRTMCQWIRIVWARLNGPVVRIKPPSAAFRASRHVEPWVWICVLVSTHHLLPRTSTIHSWVKIFFKIFHCVVSCAFFSHKILVAFLISCCQRFWGLLAFCSDVNHLSRHLLVACLIHCLRAFFRMR